MTRIKDPERGGKNAFTAIFICTAAAVILAGSLYYRSSAKHYRDEVARGLSAIAGLKAEQVAHYRDERLGDADIFLKNASFTGLVRRYFADPGDMDAGKQIQELLENMKIMGSYDSLRLLDTRGATRLSVPGSLPELPPEAARHAAETLRGGKANFDYFYRDARDNRLYISLEIPLHDINRSRRPLGIIVARADPATHLFPMLARWPIPRATAEILLVRRDGDAALILSPTINRPEAAFTLRLPLTRTELPAVRAVLGRTGVEKGVDAARGAPVLADTRAIPGSPWFLVTRIDFSEMAAPLRNRFWLTLLFVVLLTALSGMVLAFVWKQRNAGYYLALLTAAEALKESEARLKAITESILDAVIMMGPKGLVEYWNPAAEKMFGYTREEALGRDLHELITPRRFRPAQLRGVAEFQRTGKGPILGIVREIQALKKSGEEFHVSLSLAGIWLGDEWHAVGIVRDITESKNREDELRKLSLALKESPAAMIITDGEGGIEYVNAMFTKNTGYSLEEVRGKNPSILKSGDIPPEVYIELWQTLASQKSWRGELCNKKKNGELFWVSSSISPLINDKGAITHFVAVNVDITDRKLLEAELIKAKEAAEAANRAKSAFLANMSHEIRTPMNAILGFSQLLRRDPEATPKQRQQVETINRSGEHLLALINDILEISKAEAGRVKLNPAAIDLRALLDGAQMMLRPRAEAKNLRLETQFGAALPCFVKADEGKLRQIVLNLLGNAIKFTAKGAVVLRADCKPGAAGKFNITVEVEDTGPGITTEELAGLFRPFEQAQAGIKYGVGTGLGLAISRGYARLMGGEITVKSRPGTGSVFTLSVALEGAQRPAEAGKEPARLVKGLKPGQPRYRVLVADDKEDNREFLAQLLGPAGFDIRRAVDGEAALKEFEAWRPQLILMDLEMPGMDGFEAMRRVRACAGGKEAKILAVTAGIFGETRRKALEAGADDIIFKPFRDSELFVKIRNLLGAEYVYEEEDRPAPTGPAGAGVREPASLAGLPPELISRLREAAGKGDFELLAELAGQVEAYNSGLAGMLRGLAEEFDSPGILALLTKENPHDR